MKQTIIRTKHLTKEQISNIKWYEFFGERPEERARRRQIYIDICNSCWNRAR